MSQDTETKRWLVTADDRHLLYVEILESRGWWYILYTYFYIHYDKTYFLTLALDPCFDCFSFPFYCGFSLVMPCNWFCPSLSIMQIVQCHRSELVQACLKWPLWLVTSRCFLGAASKQGCSRNRVLCWWQAVGKIGTRLERPNHRIWTLEFLAGSRVWNLQNFLCWWCSCLCACTAALSDRSCERRQEGWTERVGQFRYDVLPEFFSFFIYKILQCR